MMYALLSFVTESKVMKKFPAAEITTDHNTTQKPKQKCPLQDDRKPAGTITEE